MNDELNAQIVASAVDALRPLAERSIPNPVAQGAYAELTREDKTMLQRLVYLSDLKLDLMRRRHASKWAWETYEELFAAR